MFHCPAPLKFCMPVLFLYEWIFTITISKNFNHLIGFINEWFKS